MFSPIAIFAYRRFEHLKHTLQSLMQCKEFADSPVIVFMDGPRDITDQEDVEVTRAIAKQMLGERVRYVFREKNIGLARSIISGVTEVLDEFGTVIVIEDDLVVSSNFLKYMNDGLHFYRDIERVASIHGYCYPCKGTMPETFFLRGADCWGWATWSRAWQHFEPDGRKLLDDLQNSRLKRAFDMDGAYPYTRMLRNQIAGKNDSWAVRWHASCFLLDKLTLYPGRSLVNNIGFDNSGTHCNATNVFAQSVSDDPVQIREIPIIESKSSKDTIVSYFRQHHSFRARMLRKFCSIMKLMN